jgi:hypothetical protein
MTMGADILLVGNVIAGSAITIGYEWEDIQTAVTCETAYTDGRHSASRSTSSPQLSKSTAFTVVYLLAMSSADTSASGLV